MTSSAIIRPLVTEKMTGLMERGQYAFVVRMDANKVEIARAVRQRYPDVSIKEVRTMIVRGKRRRQFTRRGVREGRTVTYKKAIVTLLEGSEPIDFFEGI